MTHTKNIIHQSWRPRNQMLTQMMTLKNTILLLRCQRWLAFILY